MFEVPHSHHGVEFKRYFSPGRNSMSAIKDKHADEFRRHVWAATMIDEDPLAGETQRPSVGNFRPSGPNKLRSKRRASAYAALPPTKEKRKSFEVLRSIERTSTPTLPTPAPSPTPSSPPAPTPASTPTPTTTTTMKGPTISVRPLHPGSFGSTSELYPVKEDSIDDFLRRTEAAVARSHMLRTSTSYPTYLGYGPDARPRVTYIRTSDSMPTLTTLNRPRKLSNSSNHPRAPLSSLQPSRENMQSGSLARRPSFESAESGVGWRPEYLQRPMPLKKKKSQTRGPNETFASLPVEVLTLILEKLRDSHFAPESESCATCWMRDVSNVCLSSRKWYKVARVTLYEHIQLVGPDSAAHKKRYKCGQGARVMMLRRTLRDNPRIGALVRSLKVPAPELPAKGTNTKRSGLAEYDDLVASLVMACPNLERLHGLVSSYDHSYKKLIHALSTRTQLKEMNWLVQPSPHQRQQRIHSSTQQLGLLMPEELIPSQERAFLQLHENWSRLETLTIHCLPGATLTPERLLSDTLSRLPSLEKLHLCNLPPNGFNDDNLLSLPRLRELTLSHISGITCTGLSAFATRNNSRSLRKLHLRHTPLTSLPTLARILSNLQCLTNFSLVQAFPPAMPEDDAFALWMMPYLASSSVQKLHWDITGYSSCVTAADDILVRSIAAGGFPELETLRVLNDPDGLFQDLCYPVARIDLPTDRYRAMDAVETGSISSVSSGGQVSPTRNLFKSSSNSSLSSPRSSSSPVPSRPPPNTNLHAARLAAQSRLESAQHKPRFTVNVFEEDGTLLETFGLAGFIGTPGSKIKYHLLPDPGSSDEKGGLLDVRDLDASSGENLAGGSEGCIGRWNRSEGVVADKKEKERWWHTERGRWTRLEL